MRLLPWLLLFGAGCQPPPPIVVTAPAPSVEQLPVAKPDVRTLLTPVEGSFVADQFSVGEGQVCARSTEGRVACWGRSIANGAWMSNEAGTATPMLLGWWRDVDQVAVHGGEVCVLQAGAVSCWKSGEDDPPPFRKPGLNRVVRLVPFSLGKCAIEAAGTVACWGFADWIDPDETTSGAWRVPGWSTVKDMWCDTSCCARDDRGAITCVEELDKDVAYMRDKMRAATDVAIAGDELCVVDKSGTPSCGGYASSWHELSLDGLKVSKLAGEDRRICAVTTSGELVCQEGSERRTLAGDVVDVIMTDGTGCALTKDGGILCWGRGEHGQLGDGGAVERSVPGPVVGLDNVIELSVAHSMACARTRDGSVHCWGEGWAQPSRQFDRVSAMSSSQYAAGCMLIDGAIRCATTGFMNERWQRISVGGKDMPVDLAALASDRGPSVFGISLADGSVHGLFSMGDYGFNDRWAAFPEPKNATAIASAALGWCAIHDGGRVSCFQDPRFDHDPDFVEHLPKLKVTEVKGLDDAVELAAGQDHYCARKKDRRVVCWGWMGFSRQHFSSSAPKEIPELEGAVSIASNQFHTCGVVDGKVRCWGDNRDGQLGIGTRTEQSGFVDASLSGRALTVGVGREHTCALLEDGTVHCWGDGTKGQLGDGRLMRSKKAVRVIKIGR